MIGRRLVDFQPDHRAEVAIVHLFFNRSQQVVRLVFFNFEIGVARHPKEVGGENGDPREQEIEIGGDNVFDPDEVVGCRVGQAELVRLVDHVFVWDTDETRENIGNFDAGETFSPLGILSHDG